ncbi:MAG: EamA family transporter [Nitrospirota bacterium]
MLKQTDWVVTAVLALLFWGGWGFFQKLATNSMPPKSVYLFTLSGAFITAFLILVSLSFSVETNPRGMILSIIAGLLGSFGGLCFVHSVSKGKASVVITMTALYPLVTIVLSFLFLREAITVKQGIGIVLALLAMLLLTT